MHSTVFEISEYPASDGEHSNSGYLPDWFYESVCDYTTKMSEDEREKSLTQLTAYLDPHCARSGNLLTFSPQFSQQYFRDSFKYFKAAARALAEADYDVFAGIEPTAAFELALSGIAESYEDKRSFYVYCPDSKELSPLDKWLHKADLSKPFYVRDAINYHF